LLDEIQFHRPQTATGETIQESTRDYGKNTVGKLASDQDLVNLFYDPI